MVYDILGKQIQATGIRQVNKLQVELDMSQLPGGTYFIKVKSGDQFRVLKLVKQ